MAFATLSGLIGGAILGVQYSSRAQIQSPRSLADAVTAAITYISATPADNDRADDDVRALESLTVTLRRCSKAERDALRAAVERARTEASSLSGTNPDVLNTYSAIKRDILDSEPG